MMSHEMPEHDDKIQDMDMIASVLQKIVDEMHSLEAGRLHPEEKPMVAHIQAEAVEPNEGTPEEESSPEDLQELLGKADHADEMGSLPGEDDHELPPEIADLIRKKKSGTA